MRVLLITILIVCLAVAGYIVVVNLPASTVFMDSGRTPPPPEQAQAVPREAVAKPVRLLIPSLGVDTKVQEVGLTAAGNMANPQGVNKFRETSWYKNGPRPGQAGSAVIDGHLDNALSLKGIFYELNKLEAGDTVMVETSVGEQATFKVIGSEIYDYKNAPSEKIFSLNDGRALLNLITCDGTWVQSEKSYDKRLVVYTELISITP